MCLNLGRGTSNMVMVNLATTGSMKDQGDERLFLYGIESTGTLNNPGKSN